MVNGWEVASAASGVIYFTAWSASFYPQLLLNHRRNSALGVSPDFVAVNPIGFFCLSVWSFGAYFSTTARRQYQDRHDGHLPQVSKSDLAFSAHALLLSSLTFVQSAWLYYRAHQRRQNPVPDAEETALLGERRKDAEMVDAPVMPLAVTRIAILAMAAAAVYKVTATALGHTQLLDLLYFASSLKIIITALKYAPQLLLNYRLKSVRGFAIGTILLDLTGGFLSLFQLVVSSVFIDHQVAGIWANPGKLGLSLLTIGFDCAFIVQNYVLYPHSRRDDDEVDESE